MRIHKCQQNPAGSASAQRLLTQKGAKTCEETDSCIAERTERLSASGLMHPALFLCLSAIVSSAAAGTGASLDQIPVKDIDGKTSSLGAYQGQVRLVVNVASECGYTPQYAGLEALYLKYRSQGLVVLGFPCNQFGEQEPGSNVEIKAFCSSKFAVTFPLFDKIEVNGPNRHPLYVALAGKGSPFPGDITWNFNKFLIGRDGKIVRRFDSGIEPESAELSQAVEAALQAK
jgi:glutathione peroxidase